MAKRAYSIKEVATALDVSPRLIRNEINRGKLKAAIVGKTPIMSFRDIADYIGEHRAKDLLNG